MTCTLEAIAKSGENIVIGCVVSESEERVYVDGEIWRYLINETGVECADPGLIMTCAHGVVEFDVAAQIADDCS